MMLATSTMIRGSDGSKRSSAPRENHTLSLPTSETLADEMIDAGLHCFPHLCTAQRRFSTAKMAKKRAAKTGTPLAGSRVGG
jgi:hypothetical protein